MMSGLLAKPHYRQAWIRLQLQLNRISKLGVLGICQRLGRKLLTAIVSIALLPISLILFICGYKRLCIFTDRIGHLAIEPDAILKGQQLGLVKKKRWFITAPTHRVANSHLLSYWQPHFTIYTSTFACFIMNCVSVWPFMRYDVSHIVNNFDGAQLSYQISKQWVDRSPLLTLSSDDKLFAASALSDLGLPNDAWFVCVHAREGNFAPVDESIHSHRNGDINNLTLAINEITKRGGWVVRLGDPTMLPMQRMPNVIDYAHHPLRSARLDIILCAKAKFILGNTSGIFLVGTIFGTPSCLVNMIPLAALGFLKSDISVPKLHKSASSGEYLSFDEIMKSNVSNFRYASLYNDKGILVEENSAIDIVNATIEMFDRLDGTFRDTNEDIVLHAKFMSLFRPTHYSYGSPARVSTAFLRTHSHLITPFPSKEAL